MKSEPTEKTKGKKMAVSETADRKNGRSPGARPRRVVGKTHDGTRSGGIRRYGCFRDGIDDSIRARCGGGIRGGEKKGHPAGTGRPREKKNERQATQGLAGGVPGNVPHRPEDQEPQDGVRQ